MPDFRISIKKLKLPLPWRRHETPKPDSAKPSTRLEDDRQREQRWYRSSTLKVAVVALAAVAIMPTSSRAQFGFDTAAILAALSKMQSFMNQYMAKPLQAISKAQQNISSYEKDVMYPVAAINQAKGFVTQVEGKFNQITSIFHLKVSSATLPQSQGLESVLLSRNTSNIPGVSQQFQSVYGVVMAQNAASTNVRNMTDMTDAQAQDAMKQAVKFDALSDAELSAANSMGQQIATAAPGSAPILEAEAAIWNVRATAYTQALLAELIRTRAIDIANQSKIAKLATTDNTTNNSLINGVLTHK